MLSNAAPPTIVPLLSLFKSGALYAERISASVPAISVTRVIFAAIVIAVSVGDHDNRCK
jgi:hypothetical protein